MPIACRYFFICPPFSQKGIEQSVDPWLNDLGLGRELASEIDSSNISQTRNAVLEHLVAVGSEVHNHAVEAAELRLVHGAEDCEHTEQLFSVSSWAVCFGERHLEFFIDAGNGLQWGELFESLRLSLVLLSKVCEINWTETNNLDARFALNEVMR